MARFYISTQGGLESVQRKDVVVDLSMKKLAAIKQAQRTTHRQANLRKTVLVYNVFRAAVSEPAMDVDNRAAEQSWFDQCLDMVADEPDEDEELDEPEEPAELADSECVLKRSRQSAGMPALCAQSGTAIPAAAAGDAVWQEPGVAHVDGAWKYANLFAANSVSLGAPAGCIY
ncbi:hypothetical protein IWW55_003032 [Coemansia sp. RSA 2706]|nr:hypothetical protein IWW55_003032 [Coemansia sp. RSA 2706]KAJ2325695.1 hypothetical protein IWW51_002659 [Coemansia sp. RSA 2702]KAJ2363772.1 hypothetical protein H4S01_004123 [Coemansia sp. RSA 2610]KAJ2384130.1 hypothetical protein H4S02_004961 [Coemansia sp. RSA 2611]